MISDNRIGDPPATVSDNRIGDRLADGHEVGEVDTSPGLTDAEKAQRESQPGPQDPREEVRRQEDVKGDAARNSQIAAEKSDDKTSDEDEEPERTEETGSQGGSEDETENTDGTTDASGVVATPGAVEHAQTLGVDISEVQGTGRGGQVTKADVESHVTNNQ
jgi:pyruvate/2-oxoglutarate dehydrogenase complex dihydrolipoamide acyltransferase (E2) component